MKVPNAVRRKAIERATVDMDELPTCEAQIVLPSTDADTQYRSAPSRICLGYAGNCHHRVNRSVGGGYSLSSLLMLCGSGTTGCHGWITVNPLLAREFGWAIRSTDDPLAHRVLYRGRWATLGDDGSVNYETD